MRGKDLPFQVTNHTFGITPAHAGKRDMSELCQELKKDHPRACGEKERDEHPDCVFKGSPPRMRGKAAQIRDAVGRLRITPAHAGKRRSPQSTDR